MKVLHIISGLARGGAERALYSLLRGGLAERTDCQVVSLGDEGAYGRAIRDLGVAVGTLEMRPGRPSLRGLWRLRRIVRSFEPNVIQGWMYHGNLAATAAQWLSRRAVPMAWNVRQSFYGLGHEKRGTQWTIRANRRLSPTAAAIVYNSELARQQHESFGFARETGLVIPNGFDLSIWKPDPQAGAALRAELGLARDTVLIGHIARYHPMKDHPTALQAFSQVATRYRDVHFVLAGRNVDRANAKLASLVAQGPAERLHLLGEREDVGRLMSALDVFCLSSSRGEGFPNVVGEAMACAVPCVVTDVGDSAAVIGETGLVVPPGDPVALANALMMILDKEEKERAALGERARERIRDNYALHKAVSRYEALYAALAGA